MSLLNIGFLNEAINEKNILEPHLIFNHVRERLIASISKEGQKDGFDGILICLNKKTKKMTYAAANNAPIIIRENQIIELPKDRMPVGKGEKTESFTLGEIELGKNDSLYLYTDGYADQFGGSNDKKLNYKRFKEILSQAFNLPISLQKEFLEQNFDVWKGETEQTDDVCVMGIKF